MNSAKLSSEGASVETSASSPKAQYLRFRTLARKDPPPDYVFIDVVLDQLGCQLFGDKWRYCTQLRKLPYAYRKLTNKRLGEFCTYRYDKKNDGQRLMRRRLVVLAEDHAAYHEAKRMFNEARRILKIALYKNELAACTYGREEINKMFWYERSKPIFYTGCLCDESRRVAPVLIERSGFTKWIRDQTAQPFIRDGEKLKVDLDLLAKVVSQYLSSKDYNVYGEEFSKLSQAILKKARIKSPSETARKLYGRLEGSVRMKHSPPPAARKGMRDAMVEKMDQDRPNLQKVIFEECIRQRAALAKKEEV